MTETKRIPDILAEIRQHLRDLAPHVKGRRTPQLLSQAVNELEQREVELRDTRNAVKLAIGQSINVSWREVPEREVDGFVSFASEQCEAAEAAEGSDG